MYTYKYIHTYIHTYIPRYIRTYIYTRVETRSGQSAYPGQTGCFLSGSFGSPKIWIDPVCNTL